MSFIDEEIVNELLWCYLLMREIINEVFLVVEVKRGKLLELVNNHDQFIKE